MSELSDLSELVTGAIVAMASVTRVVHADQLAEIRAALMTSLEANIPNQPTKQSKCINLFNLSTC